MTSSPSRVVPVQNTNGCRDVLSGVEGEEDAAADSTPSVNYLYTCFEMLSSSHVRTVLKYFFSSFYIFLFDTSFEHSSVYFQRVYGTIKDDNYIEIKLTTTT